jgi:hypothetical protein
VPQLALLNHLFGESMEMPKPVRLYQRVLIGDDVTAGAMIDKELKEESFAHACQTLLVPVLQELKRDLQQGMIDITQARRAMTILDVAATNEAPATPPPDGPLQVLFVAGQNEIDDLAATLLARASALEGVPAEALSSRSLASEAAEHAREIGAANLCIVQVAPISWTHCRHLARTLSSRLPNLNIYAVNLESSAAEPPFQAETGQLPAKRLFRDVASLMDRLREIRFIKPESPTVDAA